MRAFKLLFSAVFFTSVVLLIGGAVTYLSVDNSRLIDFMIQKIESSTHMVISYGEDLSLTRTLSPTLTIRDLTIEDSDSHLKIHSNSLQFQLSLPGLLRKRLDILKLVLGDTRVEIQEGASGGSVDLPEKFIFKPVLHHLQISQISILRAGEKMTLPGTHLNGLTIETQPDTQGLVCRLRTELGGDKWDLSASVPRLQDIFLQHRLPFSMTAVSPLVQMSAQGQILFQSQPPAIEADIQVTTMDDQLKSGRKTPVWMASILPEGMDPLKHLTLSTQISGTYPDLGIEAFKLNLKTTATLDLTLEGQLDIVHDKTGLNADNMDLALVFSAPTTRAARTLIFDDVPEFGAIKGQARFQSKNGAASLDGIKLQTLDPKGIKVDLNGQIASFPLDPDISNSGYDLSVQITSTRTSLMGERVGIDLPLKGPMNVIFDINGDTQALQLKKIDLSAGQKDDIQVNATGQIMFGSWDQADPLDHVDIAVQMESPDTKFLEGVVGKEFPNLGKVEAKARLKTVSKVHGIDDIQVGIGKAGPLALTIAGSIDQISLLPRFAADKINLAITATGDDLAVLADIFSVELSIPENNGFNIHGQIIGNHMKPGLAGLSLKTEFKDKANNKMKIRVSGQMDDIRNGDALTLDVQAGAGDLKQIGSMLGQTWPGVGPVGVKCLISKKNKTINLDTELTLKQARIHALNSVSFRKGKPFISGSIKAENMFFYTLFEKKQDETPKKSRKPKVLFSKDPLDVTWLNNVDTDIMVEIASFEKGEATFESARFKFLLDTGRLSLSPASLIFSSGDVNLEVNLNAKKDLGVRLKASGKGINPWQTLSMQDSGMKDAFDADMDVDIEITSTGGNSHELAANMDGSIFLLIKNGKIRKNLMNMLFVDLIGWSMSKTIGGKYLDIHCGVADYTITKGVVSTNAFIIDAQDIAVTGEGTIDLANEKLDYVFLPKKKSSLVVKADPVKLKGPLAAPSVTVMPWKSAVARYGSLVFGPYIFAGWTAVDFVVGKLIEKKQVSPCQEYEKKHKRLSHPP